MTRLNEAKFTDDGMSLSYSDIVLGDSQAYGLDGVHLEGDGGGASYGAQQSTSRERYAPPPADHVQIFARDNGG